MLTPQYKPYSVFPTRSYFNTPNMKLLAVITLVLSFLVTLSIATDIVHHRRRADAEASCTTPCPETVCPEPCHEGTKLRPETLEVPVKPIGEAVRENLGLC